ncbi:MAG: HAMP domain-containing protein, partial [Thermomicrobiaceae bacterium]|nr:HAMP domain-containing protein [Thermomicrobiaceae bacterium]
TLHRGLLYVAAPIRDQGQVIGAARVALPSGDVSQARHRVVAIIAGTLLVAALAIGALSLLLSKIVTRPLADLVTVARRVSAGDLGARITTRPRGEIAELATAFDEMTQALRETIRTIEQDRLQLSAIVEHLADGVLIVDERDELLLANQAAERLLGIPRGAGPGRSYVEAARDVDLVDLVQAARAPGGGEAAAQGRFVELGPPRRVVQAFAYPIPDGGAPLVVVILRDVTEFRRTEEIRRDFVANVSHELRTPIASLKALVETLLDGALEDEVAAREFLGRMEVEVDDLARLVQELLDLSRAESGRLALQTAATDVGAVVERAAARLRAQAEQRGIDLRVALPPTLPAAEVDPERVEQVLVNLLHNAVKFTPSGGVVTASAEAGAGEIVVRVADTGPGVPT